jgi:hypothetical protein
MKINAFDLAKNPAIHQIDAKNDSLNIFFEKRFGLEK